MEPDFFTYSYSYSVTGKLMSHLSLLPPQTRLYCNEDTRNWQYNFITFMLYFDEKFSF